LWIGRSADEVDGQSTVGIGSLWRDMTLYTILGLVRACCLGWRCPGEDCGELKFYEGLDNAVFAVTKTSVYMRDVLDSLVLAKSSGVSQRTAYVVQRSYMESATLRYPREAGVGKLWERYKMKDRRAVSTALSIYVSMLDSAFRSNVDCFYNCSNCQYRDEEGNWRWCGICIGGTATGVRGDLLDQYKDTVRANALPNTYRPEQFLLRKQADRAAAVCIGHAL
jgi:hypothetical protein